MAEDHWFFEQRTSSWTLHSISSSGRLPAGGRLRVLKSRFGKRLQMVSAHLPECLRTQSQAGSSTGGRTKRLPGWRRYHRDHTVMPAWADRCVVCSSDQFLENDPLSRAPSPSSSRPTPSLVAFLPMWPSIGSLWPPSCSMLESRVVGKAWICG